MKVTARRLISNSGFMKMNTAHLKLCNATDHPTVARSKKELLSVSRASCPQITLSECTFPHKEQRNILNNRKIIHTYQSEEHLSG